LDQVRPDYFKDLSSLELLDLTGNRILDIEQGSLDFMHNLNMIHFSHNSISYLGNKTLGKLVKLSYLCMNANQFDQIEFFNEMNFERIYLSMNRLKSIEEDTFLNMFQLQEIDLSFNKIERIATLFLNFRTSSRFALKFTRLKLGNNLLRAVNFGANQHLRSLMWLDLSENQIEHLAWPNFRQFTSLTYLNLVNNKIKWFDRNTFALSKLIELNLNNQAFGSTNFSFHMREFPTSLTVLDLSSNMLINFKVKRLPSLTNLKLKRLTIDSYDKLGLDRFSALTSLDLSENAIDLPSSTTFSQMISSLWRLKSLDLSPLSCLIN
jgi:Leucine-rich repeat (LRR) protein